MLRLSTLCLLLAMVTAQNGYEYNKPGKPFAQPGTTPSRPGFGLSPSNGFQSSPTTPSFPRAPQNDEYYSTGSTPGFPGSSNYPTGSSQRFAGSRGQRPQGGSTGGAQGSSTLSNPGQGPSAPTSSAFPGQTSQNYPGQDQNYPGQPGQQGSGSGQSDFGSVSTEFGSVDTGAYEGGDYSAIPGEPDKDYPVLSEIPQTSFSCNAQSYPGYYADVETRCQVFHVCANNRTYDFICPNGTIFSQQVFVCVWWNQFDCDTAPSLFDLNANLYYYSITESRSQSGFPGGLDYAPRSQESSYPGVSNPKVASGNYPESSGSQTQSADYPGSTSAQVPSELFPNSGPQGPSASYPSGTRAEAPTALYSGPETSSVAYPSGSGYPSSVGSQGLTSSFLGSRPGGSQGYPSGKPSGPSFLTGGIGGRPQGDTRFPAQQPNREYLPPRN